MAELERELRAVAAAVEYPATPDLAARVQLGRPRPAPARVPLRLAFAIGAAWFALTGVAVAAGARDLAESIAGVKQLQGATVEPTDAPPPEAEPRELDLGPETTLPEAGERLAFTPLIPEIPGGPDSVHVLGHELSLLYEPREGLPPTRATGAGLLVTEFRGDLFPEYLQKITPQATTVESLRIDGHRAIWIAGAPHFFVYRSPDGEIVERDLQVAQNVLLIEQGRVLVRMEGAFDRATAVELAGTLTSFGV